MQVSCSPIASWMSTAVTAEVDAARQSADHLLEADLLLDAVDRLVAEGRHRPVAAAAADLDDEIAIEPAAIRRVDDLGMELHAVELRAFHRRSRRMARRRDTATTRKPRGSAVTRSPWLIHTWWRSPLSHTPSNSDAVIGDLDKSAAELAMVGGLDLPAELGAHHLLAIADAEHRQAQPEHPRRAPAGALPRHAGRPAGQDDPLQRPPCRAPLGRWKGTISE